MKETNQFGKLGELFSLILKSDRTCPKMVLRLQNDEEADNCKHRRNRQSRRSDSGCKVVYEFGANRSCILR